MKFSNVVNILYFPILMGNYNTVSHILHDNLLWYSLLGFDL
jgi:hypothetical protein